MTIVEGLRSMERLGGDLIRGIRPSARLILSQVDLGLGQPGAGSPIFMSFSQSPEFELDVKEVFDDHR